MTAAGQYPSASSFLCRATRRDRADDLGAVVPARAERDPAAADFSNVIPFARPRAGDARNAPEVVLPADWRVRAGQWPRMSAMRRVAVAALSLLVHGGLFAVLMREPPPLASIGLEVMSVEIVLGATAPAGVATAPGENQVQSASAPEEKSTEAEQTEQKATEQPQTVEVAKQETAPEQKTEQPKTETKPEEPKPSKPPPRPSRRSRPSRSRPSRWSRARTRDGDRAAARDAADTTEVTLLPQPEDKPVEKKPDPKPVQAAPPKPVKDAAPAQGAAPHRGADAREGRQGGQGLDAVLAGEQCRRRPLQQRHAIIPGLVSAHLRRYQQYPADARSRGDQGTASVTFGIGGSGGVTSVRLARSSGVGSIDQEVQAMVRRASPFPAPPGGGRRASPFR